MPPDTLRESGISAIGAVPWGTHFCQFYKTRQDLLDILVPYFAEGLAHHEFCLWVTSEPLGTAEAEAALRRAVPDLDHPLAAGQLEILDYRDWYRPGGTFDADLVLQGWVTKLDDARARGFEGLRLTGNTFWLESPEWRSFMAYEEKVNAAIGRYRMLALCTYSLERCGVEEVLDVVDTHQFALIEREGRWTRVQNAELQRAEAELRRYRETLEDMVRVRTEELLAADEEQRKAEELLRHGEERYRSLVTATTQIVWTTDPQGLVVADLPGWRAFTGQTYEELRGAGWADALHPEDRARTLAVWTEAVRTRSMYDTEYRLRRRDGTYRVVAARGVPVLERGGSIREWVGTCTDITERKEAEAVIRNLNAELERRVQERTAELAAANQELEAFAYSVSHDLRAPLRAIDGFGQILLEDYAGKLDEQGRDYIGRMRAASQRMAGLIEDLLALSRVTRAEMRRRPVDLSALAREIAEELRRTAPDRRVVFVAAEGAVAHGDDVLLRTVLTNLLDNAWKFTAPRPEARIEFGAAERDGRPAYFVKDNGVGFDKAYADKLFGPFQRLHSVEEFPGSGIGLATVKRIVHRHGGRVWAEGEVGKGATFWFTLA